MNIIITGASQGIGFDVALLLSQDPNNQILAISRNEKALAQLASLAAHSNIQYIAADIVQPTALQQAQILQAFTAVDVLINNAGLLVSAPFAETPTEAWLDMYQLHVVAPARLLALLLPRMARPSHVVNIGSMGGFQGSKKFPGLAAYSASKAALACLSECLSEELKGEGIAVNCLALGAAQTEMLSKAFPGYQAPLSSQEMAEFVAQFCLTGHQFFNGKILPVSVDTP